MVWFLTLSPESHEGTGLLWHLLFAAAALGYSVSAWGGDDSPLFGQEIFERGNHVTQFLILMDSSVAETPNLPGTCVCL